MRAFRRAISLTFLLASSSAGLASATLSRPELVISIKDQTMTLLEGARPKARFQISTSKFGVGDGLGTFRTPLGLLSIDRKIGSEVPAGAVFKSLQFTGEVVLPNAPGRDPIVTRVLCLRGCEPRNSNASRRGIYIHGTTEEGRIGKPASYGCIRMRSKDIIALYNAVPIGTPVRITDATKPSGSESSATEARSERWFE